MTHTSKKNDVTNSPDDTSPETTPEATASRDNHPLTRRMFVKAMGASAATIAMTACGGSSAGGVFSPGNTAPPFTSGTSDPLTGGSGTGTLSTSFQLTSATGGTNLPFTLGHAFKKGDVPAGANVVGNLASLQVNGKSWWPDGSLKFAIISGRATFAAGVPVTVTLNTGTAASAPNLTTGNLKVTGLTAMVGAGSFGTASWLDNDWDAPFQVWASGPQMSSWIYRKQVGSDAHLVAWLEVRLYEGGAVELLPWVENGYLNVAGATNKNASYSFAIGGSQRFSAAFDLPNHCRAVLASGTVLSHWLGTSPQITPKHNVAYLQETRLVPSYRAAVSPSAAIWSSLAQTYTPLQQGNYQGTMGAAGYHGSIGLLPEWDVLYLTSQDARTYAGVIVNGYGAGRFGIHFRDETTQRPLRFSSYPNLVLNSSASGVTSSGASSKNSYTAAASGTSPQTWASSHHPSVGFMAYLITGRFYFMEEVQFAATLNYLKNTDIARQLSQGVFLSNAGANTTRGAAWALRTLAQAACVTSDSDTALRAEFLASVEANVNYYHDKYVARPNNSQGFVAPYSDYTGVGDGAYFEAAWMQDFFTAAYGYTVDLEPAISAGGTTKLKEFFAWKARSVIGRLGGTSANEFLYRDAAPYTVAVAPSDTPDFEGGTGPWYDDWGQIYRATVGTPNSGIEGDLRGGYYPEGTSYWGNLQPALAYAVAHNVPGALNAYNRLINASNWNQIVTSWNNAPVWSVKPRNA